MKWVLRKALSLISERMKIVLLLKSNVEKVWSDSVLLCHHTFYS